MEDQVISVFSENRRRYGVRRIVKELGHRGQLLSNYKVRQHLRRNGLRAIQPRSFVPKTTNSRHSYRISPNLMKNRAVPDAPNQVWVGDITYIPMTEGRFLYLSVWMDLCSRKIVGWDLQDHMRESLILTSLRKAFGVRKIRRGLIVHSDRGGQYAGRYFRRELAKHKILQSMSDADNPYDNAHMESFFSRFKAEMLEGGAFRTAEDARSEIFEYIELYYNARRLHSSIGYLSPNNFETL
jgi:putative transposase